MTEKRIALIEKYLKQEGNAMLLSEMPKGMIRQLCDDFYVDRSEIVGFYEDVMQLGGAIFASLRSRYNTRGVLFLKDRFLYNKGFLYGIIEMPYDNIKFVKRNMASTVIYTGEYNEDGTNKTLKLSGLSFEESSPVPMLIEDLRNLNEDVIEIGFSEKFDDARIRATKFLDFLAEEGRKTYAKAEAESESMADEIIAREPPKYTPVGNQEAEEKLRRQREAVEKAKAFKEKQEANRERAYTIAMERAEAAKEEEEERRKAQREEDAWEYEDDDEDDCYEEEDVDDSYDEEDEDSCEDEQEHTQEACHYHTNREQSTINSQPKKETNTADNPFAQLIEQFARNPLPDEIPTTSFSAQTIASDIWMYLNRTYDCPEECFFDYCMTLRIQNKALHDACNHDFRVPNELIYFGFAQHGVKNFQSGFAVTKNYLLYKLPGEKASNIPLRRIHSISHHERSVFINGEIEFDTSNFSYPPKLIADILNFFVVKYLKREYLI